MVSITSVRRYSPTSRCVVLSEENPKENGYRWNSLGSKARELQS